MKKLLILGAGTAGTMSAARLSKQLDLDAWEITMVDQDPIHYYQPGYLFVPFDMYTRRDCIKPKRDFIPRGVSYIQDRINGIDPQAQTVSLAGGKVLRYDFLIIATGADIAPDETSGLLGEEWGRSVQTFYTLEGAVRLADKLRTWEGGRLLVNVVENPIKCPVAPLEFLMLADWYFHERGIREKVELVYATPLPGAFTKPTCTRLLNGLLAEKGINVETEFFIERMDAEGRKIVSYDEREVEYDLLVSIPLNKGAAVVGEAGLGDALNYVPVNKHTFLSDKYPNIFALGDASNAPTSKAGSVAHFAVELFAENFQRYIRGGELLPTYDGHTNCFIESGYGKGMLIDFNYEHEPVPGEYPLPGVGPFKLLEETELNHWGKLMFRWMYWHLLLRGMDIPLPAVMSLAGKRFPGAM